GQACVRPPANTCVRLAPHVVKDLGTALTRAAAIRVELERTKQQRLLKLSLDLLRQLRRLDLAFCALRRICGHTTSGRYDAEGKP
ncbi:MAG TPA: hypothetical protein VNN12_09500, partial [Dehalococcoidia bacterium]|nr:hypothetical protein [Dehalococcoidia bacterium]